MNRGIKIALWCVIAVVLWVGIGLGASTVRRQVVFGDVHTEAAKAVTVGRGDRFSLAVRDRGASVGDHWTQRTAAPDVVTVREERHEPAGGVLAKLGGDGGGDGTRYFVFEARRPGTTTVVLSNCFQGCTPGWREAVSRSISWTITVE